MTLLALLGVATLVYPPTLFWAQDRPLLSSQVGVASSSLQQAVKTYRQGDFGNALALLKQAQKEEPANSNVNYYLAVCLDKLIRYGEALQEYQYVAKHSEDPQVVDYALYRIQSIKQRLNPQPPEAVSTKSVETVALTGSRASSKPVILFNNSNGKEASSQASPSDKNSEKLAVKPALPFSDLNNVIPREVVSIV
ncbi:MAG: tetratricopeptide repeat protein, partial [Cyanobacteria bacterium]|nr:tetratricopeptide repeat protein [Cyanobacteriota bacterium]